MSRLGDPLTRQDARAKVTGEALYPGDIDLPGQLWMKVLFANRPHARIKRIDTSRAESAAGVARVFTARDVPVNEYGLILFDNPVLCGEVVRWIGDKVALVVAETEKQAEHARDLIEVEYEDLPIATDPRAAMEEGAPQIHPTCERNILKSYRIRKGDIERGWNAAEVVVEDTYQTPMQEHAFLQPEAGVAYLDEEGRVTIAVAGQWAHEDQEQVAHALGLPREQVRVIYPAIGGAFGGREDMSVQIILALAAWKLGRPVKIIWSREESIQYHCKRHAMFLRARTGATREGKLVAAEVEIVADAGAYAFTSTKVLGNATLMCTGPYEIPNVKVDSHAVYTNNIPAGAFRGFGAPQGHFVAETQMNKLAEKLGMDPVALRLKNLLREGSLTCVQTPLPGGPVTLVQVAESCAREFGWTETQPGGADSIARGKGFACAFKNVGFSFAAPEGSWAAVELKGGEQIEQATVFQAGADVGQGSHTAMRQMAAEALGLPVERVILVASDTAFTETSGSASASRLTYMSGNAIRGAAAEALARWHDEERPARGEFMYRPAPTQELDEEGGRSTPNFAYGYVAQAVEVEVDTETGQVHVARVTSAHDVGRAVNRNLIEGQVEGGVIQALGYGVLENFVMQGGKVLTPYLSNYLIPGVLDIPERIDTVILEHADEDGPWGVRGMAEMPIIPLAPAIVAAVHNATGVWINELPLTPWRVQEALAQAGSHNDLLLEA